MPYSPEEIVSKRFSKTPDAGYDPAEVDRFLAELANEFRVALASEVTDGTALDEASNQAAEMLRSAREWAENRLLAGEQEAHEIEQQASDEVGASLARSRAREVKAYEAAHKEAESVIAEAASERKARLDEVKRQVDQLIEDKDKQPLRFSTTRQQLINEVENAEVLTLHLRTDLAEARRAASPADEGIRILVVASDDRSLAPMAAGLIRRALIERGFTQADVSSAGTQEQDGHPPDDQIRGFLNARGIDISRHRSRSLDAGDVMRSDLVIGMTQSDRNQILERVPEANAVLLKELPVSSVDGRRQETPRERIRAVVAQAGRGGDKYDLPDPVGVWPRLYHQCLYEMRPAIDALVSVLAGDDSTEPDADRGTATMERADDNPSFFDWLKYYKILVALLVLVGMVAGALYLLLRPRQYEASTLVVDTGRQFTARQLALVSEATFRSPAVVTPTMSALGIDVPQREFLEESVELRPIPDTNTMTVIGRADSMRQAQAISEEASESFVAASNSRTGLTELVVFGKSQAAPIQQDVTSSVALFLGATAGFWLGIALAVLHYRLKRPVLAFARAVLVSRADKVTIVDGGWSWLGILRPKPPVAATSLPLQKYSQGDVAADTREQPITWFGEGNGTRVVVAHSGTRERELELAGSTPSAMGRGSALVHVQLVWLR
jgi:DivIVA domain-containing protein